MLDGALDIDFTDYEEAVLHEAARAVGANAIITRDRRDFANSAVRQLAEFWLILQRSVDPWDAAQAIKDDVARIKPLSVT